MKKPEKMHVELSEAAENDLREIAAYIVRNNYSIEIIDMIRETAVKKLESAPFSNAVIRKSDGEDMRKILVLRKNVVYYYVNEAKSIVQITQIRAGGMKERL